MPNKVIEMVIYGHFNSLSHPRAIDSAAAEENSISGSFNAIEAIGSAIPNLQLLLFRR